MLLLSGTGTHSFHLSQSPRCKKHARPSLMRDRLRAMTSHSRPPPPVSPVCQSNDEFLSLHSSTKHAMMKISGSINGKPATILIDSGASANFVDSSFLQRHHIGTLSGKAT